MINKIGKDSSVDRTRYKKYIDWQFRQTLQFNVGDTVYLDKPDSWLSLNSRRKPTYVEDLATNRHYELMLNKTGPLKIT